MIRVRESSGKVRGKIQAARQWLNQAEEHFGGNSPVRGEMDLLLAEAELRSTRETLRSGQRWLTLTWIRQGVAFLLAASIAAAGLGGAWWWWQESRSESVAATVAVPAVTVSPVPVLQIAVAPAPKPVPMPVAAVESSSPGQEVNNADRPANRESSLSQDEMKRLIQAAGQSLRGRTKP